MDNSQSLFWIDLAGGDAKKIASEPIYWPTRTLRLRPAWSPDSRWIVYTLGNKAAYHRVYAHELAAGKSRPITDGLSDAIDPVFDAAGKYLYFFASTDAGPVNHWFAQSSQDMRARRSVYLVVLRKGVPSPLARESDEEKPLEKPEKKDGKPGERREARREGRQGQGCQAREAGTGGDRLRRDRPADRRLAVAGGQLHQPPGGTGRAGLLSGVARTRPRLDMRPATQRPPARRS